MMGDLRAAVGRRGALIAAAALVATACASAPPPTADPATPTPSPTAGVLPIDATPRPTPTAEPAPTGPGVEREVEPFDATTFSDPTRITNRWLPLAPGTRWHYEGHATIDGVRSTRTVVLTITDLTKEIAGIRTIMGFELDFTDGVLTESELAFWAQDDFGTVWRFGEYPEAYEEGEIVETPAWFHGLEEAAAGISMKADPAHFGPSYAQGWGPAVGWNDRGRVFEVGSFTCVPVDCYEDVLVIDEFSVDDPDVHQLKYYARGTGLVRVGWAGAREEEREELELVSVVTLSAAEMDAVREAALDQEERGFELSFVYAQLPPLVRL